MIQPAAGAQRLVASCDRARARGCRFAALSFALGAAGCGGRDFGGNHAGKAQGSVTEGGTSVSLSSPSELVDVRKEDATYVLTVRGCVLRGERRGDGFVEFPDQRCKFDVPGQGPTAFSINGQMTSVTKAPLHRILRASVVLHGEDRTRVPKRRLTYLIEPVYDP